MTNRYPLHHEDARPLYLEIPQDEYDRINSRIAELQRMDTEHTMQIAKMNGYIHHLEEERRWRKFSEEKPDDKHVVLVSDGEWFETAIYHDDGTIDFGDDIHFSNITEAPYWMPLPEKPKEDK
jgi:hypothetical protein